MSSISTSTPSSPPQPARYITTHFPTTGHAVFSTAYPTTAPSLSAPFGSIATIYTTSQFPVSLTHDADLRQYEKHVEHPPGVVSPGGTAVGVLALKPGAVTPMHRTVSLDCCVALEGEIEFELDGGEKRILRAGDTYVQRGTCHRFTNVTLGDGWAGVFAVSQEIQPVEVNGVVLEEEWRE